MPVVDVKNLEGKKVGTVELADDVFSVKVNENLLHETVRHYLAGKRSGTHKTKIRARSAARAESSGSRRARAARVSVPSGRRSGATAARYTARCRENTITRCPKK